MKSLQYAVQKGERNGFGSHSRVNYSDFEARYVL